MSEQGPKVSVWVMEEERGDNWYFVSAYRCLEEAKSFLKEERIAHPRQPVRLSYYERSFVWDEPWGPN